MKLWAKSSLLLIYSKFKKILRRFKIASQNKIFSPVKSSKMTSSSSRSGKLVEMTTYLKARVNRLEKIALILVMVTDKLETTVLRVKAQVVKTSVSAVLKAPTASATAISSPAQVSRSAQPPTTFNRSNTCKWNR